MRGEIRVKKMDPVPENQRKPGRERDGRPATQLCSSSKILGSGLNPRRRSGLNRRLTNRPGYVADWMAESTQAGDS